MIWYSQEARAYMLFAFLCGLSFLFFSRVIRRGPSTTDIVWWAVFSALAVLTHFFAGFLVAPEALWMLARVRTRAMVVAAGAVAAVQAAIVPLAASDTTHPLQWIQAFPLSIRIKQIPVDFGLSSLYQSSLVTHGLLAAGVLVACVVLLLYFGGGERERHGAAVVAAVAAFVILVPIVLAWLGRDYVVPRNFMPAWIPMSVVLAAACTAPRTLPAGAALAALMLGVFVYAGIRIDREAQYQRPDWRGVASALGRPTGPRAIVAYDSGFAAQPLAVYLPRVPWSAPAEVPVTVGEVDVVGSTYQAIARPLPAGVRLLGTKSVGGFLVARFGVGQWRLAPRAIATRAQALLGPAPPSPAVLLQGA
jgi:hypothetical protein